MKSFIILFSLIVIASSCANKSPIEKIFVDTAKLDSIRKNSDTSYIRPINSSGSNIEQYLNLDEGIITKITKDTAGGIKEFVQFRSGKKIEYAEFYSNGQLKASVLFDSDGQLHGPAKYYYEDGRVKSIGSYNHGLYSGEWKNYSAIGELESADKYDVNGAHLENEKPK